MSSTSVVRVGWVVVVLGMALTWSATAAAEESANADDTTFVRVNPFGEEPAEVPAPDESEANAEEPAETEMGVAELPPPRQVGVSAEATLPPPLPAMAPPQSGGSDIGLSLSLEIASAYVFRGLNIFQTYSQLDQNFLAAPQISYTVPHTGLSFTYWGAYQITGGNEEELVRAGLGHEQDLVLAYQFQLFGDLLTLDIGLTWYFLPFATEEAAGADCPHYLEPGLVLAYSGFVDAALQLAYFAGVQEEFADGRYTYIRPSIGRSFELNSWLSLSLALGFGFKIFNRPSRNPDNVFDFQVDWGLDIATGGGFTLSPAVHFGWTNLEDVPIGGEYVIWWSLGTNLDL